MVGGGRRVRGRVSGVRQAGGRRTACCSQSLLCEDATAATAAAAPLRDMRTPEG